jgi:hypothetical protein
MKRLILLISIFIICLSYIYPEISVSYYLNKFTTSTQIRKFILIDKKDIKLEIPYNAVDDIDSVQYYRITLSAFEKARIINLKYVGNKISFNNVEISCINEDIYSVKDIGNSYKIDFMIGELDSIQILTCLDFNEKGIDLYDKIATVILVKNLLKIFNNNPEKDIKVPDMIDKTKFENEIINRIKRPDDILFMYKIYILDSKTNTYILTDLGKTTEITDEIKMIMDNVNYQEGGSLYIKERAEAYLNFINQLKSIDKKSVFDYLKRYIELNFQITFAKDFLSPYDLFHSREGNTKSIAYFYYFTLKNLDMEVKSYLVTEMKKRKPEDVIRIKNLKDIEADESFIEYKNVRPDYNHLLLLDYYPPDFNASVYLVTLKIKKNWIYTTGEKWVDEQIFTPERCTTAYTKKGCYYSLIVKDDVYNSPLKPDDIIWDLFFDSK